MELQLKNRHDRDELVQLHPNYDENHIYLIRSTPHTKQGYISVTTFISKFFDKFDPDKILENWVRKDDPRLLEKTPQEWKRYWKTLGIEAAKKGTHMHKQFEEYFNDRDYEIIEEMQPFFDWIEEYGIQAYRTEMTVFSDSLKLVGNIDLITDNGDGTYDIWDFKRKEEIKSDNFGKYCTYPFSHLPDSEMTKYQLQLSIYKFILEQEYGIKVRKLWNLCVFGYKKRVYEQKYLFNEMFALKESFEK